MPFSVTIKDFYGNPTLGEGLSALQGFTVKHRSNYGRVLFLSRPMTFIEFRHPRAEVSEGFAVLQRFPVWPGALPVATNDFCGSVF